MRELPVALANSGTRLGRVFMVYVTRRADFSASHFYHNPELSAEENQRLFGKCNNPHGHGHNYCLEVTVAGDVDPRTGMVMDIADLKKLIDTEVMQAMDHRFLNQEVPAFRDTIPTTENIALEVWKRLQGKLTASRLHCVRLYETPDLYVDYYGE
jgi:6-pyruvoyltetrahydropterin/6-carboxytetrahydropterin synthase